VTAEFLHRRDDFIDLVRIVADNKQIDPYLVEKDYWIMHCLSGLQDLKLQFELKGGTSLSKGFGIIDRFSEDIDIRIEPPADLGVATNPNQDKRAHRESREQFYDWLTQHITIDGIESVERATEFDDVPRYRSGGVRLIYASSMQSVEGIREGVLLEAGFDTVTPNQPCTISSWIFEFAKDKAEITDNQAVDVACYHPGYTFVEKLQTISTKYRKHQDEGGSPREFMRHYYDVYRLLEHPLVKAFIGSGDYVAHKQKRFRKGDSLDLTQNDAFHLRDDDIRSTYKKAFEQSAALFYRDFPDFDDVLHAISAFANTSGV